MALKEDQQHYADWVDVEHGIEKDGKPATRGSTEADHLIHYYPKGLDQIRE